MIGSCLRLYIIYIYNFFYDTFIYCFPWLNFLYKHNLVGHIWDLGDLKTIISASFQSTTKRKKSMINASKKFFFYFFKYWMVETITTRRNPLLSRQLFVNHQPRLGALIGPIALSPPYYYSY